MLCKVCGGLPASGCGYPGCPYNLPRPRRYDWGRIAAYVVMLGAILWILIKR